MHNRKLFFKNTIEKLAFMYQWSYNVYCNKDK
nr:MAG TPA: hypothetical protein [Caudoviricetes sp.]